MISGFEAYLAELPEVVSVFVVSGDDDFVVHVAVPDIERRTPSSWTAPAPAGRW